MKKLVLSILPLMMAMAITVTGCSGGTKAPAPSPSGETPTAEAPATEAPKAEAPATEAPKAEAKPFVYGLESDPSSNLNVLTTGDRFGLMVLKMVYSPLYMYNSADSIDYFLAESITPSADNLTYTAKLRQGVKWHDGQPFTADDVVFTYEEALKESNAANIRDQLIINGKPITIQKIDDYTVNFVLPELSMNAVESLGGVFIMAKHIYNGESNIEMSAKNENPVGTGPYKLAENKSGEYLKFDAFADYFLGTPKIANMYYRIIGDPNSAQLALQNNEINALIVTPADAAKFASSPNIKIVPYSENRVGYAAINEKRVKDPVVRQAIVRAINKMDILKASYVSADYADVAPSYLPKKGTFFTTDVPDLSFNPEESKKLLAQAGAKDLKLKLAYGTSNKVNEKQAMVIQQNLQDVGITLELVAMESNAWYEQLRTKEYDFDMYLNGYIMGVDPDTYASSFVTGGEMNFMNYSNPEVDKLFAAGKTETDLAKRGEMYKKTQQLIIGDACFIPLVENKRLLAIDATVEGLDEAKLIPVYTFDDASKLYFK